MGIKLKERKPFSETILGQSDKKYILNKVGVDTRTTKEIKEENRNKRIIARFNTTDERFFISENN